MCKCMRALVVLAISLFATQCWAGTCNNDNIEGVVSCTNTFSPTDTTGTYEFFSNGRLVVRFDTVLTTFTLTATVNHTIDPLDPNEFPSGTVCVTYSGNGGQCDQYDFTGSAGGPNGVPVKNTDYKGLITLTLSYLTNQTVNSPAFGHAPGDTTTITEDILTSYSAFPLCTECDPTMGGTTPGLSSVVALDEPLVENDTFCSLTATPTNNASQQKPQEEVTLSMTSGACSGAGIRDKTARLSVSTTDINGNVTFPALKNVEGNKFHWDNKNRLNEYDISSDGLVTGQTYTITVFSSKISPQSTSFVAP